MGVLLANTTLAPELTCCLVLINKHIIDDEKKAIVE